MTTSHDRIIQTLEFDTPDRIPRDLWTLPWANTHHPNEIEKIREQVLNIE